MTRLLKSSREYLKKGNVTEIAGVGITGTGKRLAESIVETIGDVVTLTEDPVDVVEKLTRGNY